MLERQRVFRAHAVERVTDAGDVIEESTIRESTGPRSGRRADAARRHGDHARLLAMVDEAARPGLQDDAREYVATYRKLPLV
jgi:hypothetical protein